MPRAFSSGDVVQHSANALNAADPGVSVANPTTEGNSGVIMMMVASLLASPEQWDIVASSGPVANSPQAGVMCRACTLSGEQTWAFSSTSGLATNFAWVAEEWTNLSFAPLLSMPTDQTGVQPPANLTAIGPSGTWDATEYAVGIAIVGLISAATDGITWPTVAWSGGFTETDVLAVGTGDTANDVKLHVARRYGTAGETGPWTAGVTLAGGWADATTNKTAYSALAIFRAAHFVGEA